jgi:hypothetical protein
MFSQPKLVMGLSIINEIDRIQLYLITAGLSKGDVDKDQGGLKTMIDLGKTFAWLMEKIKIG